MPDVETQPSAGVGSTPDGGGNGSPTIQSPSVSSPAGTIAQSDGQTEQGPVPYARFSEVNQKYNNLRWAEAHDHQLVQQQQAFFDWLDKDPVGAFRYMEDYLSRSGALPKAQPVAHTDDRPQPDVVVPETGQRFYSAEAAEKLAKWQAEQLLNERLSPIERQLQDVTATHTSQRAQAEAQRTLAEAETWPHYKDHESQILTEMEKDRRLSLEGAYRRVVMPKLRELERQALVKEINDKRGASTVNPGSSTPTERQPVSKMSWSEVFKREMAKRR